MSSSTADQLSGALHVVQNFFNDLNLYKVPDYEALAKSLNEFCPLAPMPFHAVSYIIDHYWNTGDKESLENDLLIFIRCSNDRASQPKNIKKEYLEAPIHPLSADYDKEAMDKLRKQIDDVLRNFDIKYEMSKAGEMQAPHDSDSALTVEELQELREEMLAGHHLGFFV